MPKQQEVSQRMQNFVSHSDMESFKKCRQAWDFASPLRRGLSPKVASRALQLGTVVHMLLEVYYSPTTNRAYMVDALNTRLRSIREEEIARITALGLDAGQEHEARQQLTQVLGKAAAIMTHYRVWARENDAQWISLASEQTFNIPVTLPTGEVVSVLGTFDTVFEARTSNTIWINDFKVTGASLDWYTQYVSFFSAQARTYVWAAQKLYPDKRIGGVMFTLLKNDPPRKPALLKNGGLSKAKHQATTWELYRQAAQELGLAPEEYSSMEEVLKHNSFVRRIQVAFHAGEIEAFDRHLKVIAQEMLDPQVEVYPSPDFFGCQRCAFKEPCRSSQQQNTTAMEYLLNLGYVPSKYAESKRAQAIAAYSEFDDFETEA